MKKTLFLAVIIGLATVTTASAQGVLDQAKKAAGTTQTGNTGNLTSSIMGMLTPSLGLSNAQQPQVQNLITGFLQKKAGIMPLQQTNPADYTSKFNGLQGGLFSKLKGILSAAQYTKFLGLKPKTNDATNALSQLFF
ncbi:hypothetical protein SAMN05444266_10494 [Chitinophaga jiangningensis]|uniref:DUF2780 domain-containing protein n=1 Tax=Chitinophaga jiangningensis TaxID=1419482 RepID=A0A1M7BVW0_9BACT|nr:hypothetical protein [Chitinophaga jiangningensis]SHL59067.1 hypothetical protein SAMN05444266_10494 [Chitinophaga jiangningensis]